MTLTYDPMLRLYQVAGASTTRFAYDGLDAIAEYNGTNALQRRFVFDPTSDQPVVWYEGTGTAATDRRYLSSDERGSVISVSDSSGAAISLNTYDEYGRPGASNLGRFQYTGQMWLPELGLYYYKARLYAPHIGRFMQTDPIGYEDSPNLYNYVLGDPLNLADPTGSSIEKPTPPDPYPWGSICNIYASKESHGDCQDASAQWFVERHAGALGQGSEGGLSCSSSSGPGAPTTGGTGHDDPIVVTGGRITTTCTSGPVDYRFDLISTFGSVSVGTPLQLAMAQPAASHADFCGSNGSSAVPDRVGGTDITGPCAIHDECYGSNTERKQCDFQLMLDIWTECKRQSNTLGCYAA